jgi:hypothetical protein
MCVKKPNVEVSSVRMQEENTNSGGKREKTSRVVQGKTTVAI